MLGGTLAYSGTSQGATNVGTYVITPEGLTSDNYDITFENGQLSVTKADLTVTAIDDSKVYDGLAYSGGNGVTYDGFVNGETEAVLGGTLAYSGTSQGATNVGTYVITPEGLTSDNYDITFENGQLSVTKADLTVTAIDDSKVYDGLAYSGGNGVTYDGFVNGETEAVLGGTLAYSGTSQGATNVGTYVITPEGLTSDNYDITFENGQLSVTKADLTVTAIDDSKVYDGLAYSGGNGVTYDGFVNGETEAVLGGTLAYSGTSQGATNVGTYVITPEGLTSDNYDITFENGQLSVTKADLTVTAIDDSKVYDGLAYSGGNSVTYDGFVNGETEAVLGGTLAYSGTSQGATNVGTYVITPEGLTSDNYDITFENGQLSVTKADLTVTAIDDSKVYDGLAYSGGNGVTYDGFVNGETEAVLGGTLAYSGTSQGATNVGTYVITPEGLTSDNYDITFENGQLSVTKADLTVTAIDDSKVYDGLAYSGGNGVTYDGFVNGETEAVLGGTLAYSGTSQGATNVGTYVITPEGLTSDNYDITFENGQLSVTKADLTVTAIDDSKVYDGLAYSGGNGVTYDGFVNGETEAVLGGTLAYSGTSQGATNVGTYVITPEGLTSDNYDITFENGQLSVTKADLTVTAIDDSKVYDGLAYSGGNGVTYDGFVNGETEAVLGGTLAYSGTSQGATNVGTYVITPEGLTSDNYDITFENGQLSVTKADLTVTAIDDSKVYDGLAYSGGNGVTYDGFVNGETEAVLGGTLAYSGTSQGATNVGTYVITPEGLTSDNYDITFENGQLSVTKADLTVTAIDDSKVYDGLAYSGGNGVTYDGFVNGETEAVLGGTLAYSGTSQGATNVGTYVITPEGLTSDNYDITFENGQLSVTKADLTVTAIDDSKYCGQLNPKFTVSYDGFVNGENESVLGGTLAFTTAADVYSTGANYSVTPSGLTSGNYTITFEDGTLTILVVSIDASASSNPVALGSNATLSATVVDENSNPIEGVLVTFSLDDVVASTATTNANGIATLPSVSVPEVHVYKVTAVAGGGCSESVAYLPVYDPTAGFVTGGGWIWSPAGAYAANESLEGKANFGFVAKYKKGKAAIPEVDGNTEFQFKAGNLNFKSQFHESGSLVISGGKATYRGEGTINGEGSYKFTLVAFDGDWNDGSDPDRFRIKIWGNNGIVYDNAMGTDDNSDDATELGGGSIVIHEVKSNGKNKSGFIEPEFEYANLNVYPNPFTDRVQFEFVSPEPVNARIDVYDMTGRMVKTVFEGPVEGGVNYNAVFKPQSEISGFYLYRMTLGEAVYNGKLIYNKK